MMLTPENTAREFQQTPPHAALLPLACLEPHGPHLPVGADQLILAEIARRVAQQLPFPTFLLPVWPLGTSIPHLGQAGAISLKFETLWSVVGDIVASLFEHGIRSVAVINNHGSPMTTTARPLGNFIVKTAVRQLNYETPGLTAIWVQPFAAARRALLELFPSGGQDVHAGAIETSILMAIAPALVGELPQDHIPEVPPAWLDYQDFHDLAPGGVWGKPNEASAEKGRQALEAVVIATAGYIEQSFEQLKRLKG